MKDLFDLQDQVTLKVVGAIAPRIEQAEIERAKRKPTESLDAYDYFLRGMAGVHEVTKEGNQEALAHFHRSIELNPNFSSAYGMAARCYSQRKVCGWLTHRDERLMTKQACEFAGEVCDGSEDKGLGAALRSHVCVPMIGPES